MKGSLITAALTSISLLTACGASTEGSSMVVTDSSGIAVVTASGEDYALAWTAEEVLAIRPAGEDGNGFFGVSDVAVLPGNRIVVLDGDGKQLVLFDEEGRLLAQYGREGSGPGEFQYPLELAVTPAGGLVVFDLMNRRLERFDSLLSPQAPDPFQVPYFGGRMAYAGSFLVLPTSDVSDPADRVDVLSAINETDTLEVVRYKREQGGTVQLESCGMGFSGMPRIFAPTTRWAAGRRGEVAVVGTGRYEVDLYRAPDFRLERRIRRPVPVLEATESMAKTTVGDAMRVMTPGGVRICDAAEVVEKRGFAPEVPPIARIAISPAGKILIQRWAPDDEPRPIDVLATDGTYLGTLEAGFPFPVAFLGEDRFVVTEEDELELTSVVVYRIGE